VTFIEKEEGFFHQAAQFSLTVDVGAKTLKENLLFALPEVYTAELASLLVYASRLVTRSFYYLCLHSYSRNSLYA